MSCQYETGTNFDRVFQANDLQDIEGAYAKLYLGRKRMASTGLGRKLNMSSDIHKEKLKGSSLVKLMYCKCTPYISPALSHVRIINTSEAPHSVIA